MILAALGIIVAILAFLGYREIKSIGARAAKRAVERTIEAKLKEYPDAALLHERYKAVDTYLQELLRKETILNQIRASTNESSSSSKTRQTRNPASKRPGRYPKQED